MSADMWDFFDGRERKFIAVYYSTKARTFGNTFNAVL